MMMTISRAMMRSDPWSQLGPPPTAETISGRRVDEDMPWDFFWGVDHGNHCLLILRHSLEATPRERVPRLRGIDVFYHLPAGGERPSLVWRLNDATLRDVFF